VAPGGGGGSGSGNGNPPRHTGGSGSNGPANPVEPTAGSGRPVQASTGNPIVPSVDRGPGGPIDLVGSWVRSAADQLGSTVQPAAVVAVAATFGFPLALMLAVLLFLIVQSRLDGRDPKLRSAPLTKADTFLPFADEVATR